MRLEVNKTANGVVAPDKNSCKVNGCNKKRLKGDRPQAFCKKHSGLRCQIAKSKFKELISNNEVVVGVQERKQKGPTSKRKKWQMLKNQLLKGE